MAPISAIGFSSMAKYLEGFALAKTFKDDAAGMGKPVIAWVVSWWESEHKRARAPPFVKWFICVAYMLCFPGKVSQSLYGFHYMVSQSSYGSITWFLNHHMASLKFLNHHMDSLEFLNHHMVSLKFLNHNVVSLEFLNQKNGFHLFRIGEQKRKLL